MDNELFWKLLEPVHPKAEAFCRKLCADRDDGDDLYQESLLAAIRKVGTLKDRSAFRPWLFRIIVNGYRNQLRKRWWRRPAGSEKELRENKSNDDPSKKYDAARWLERAMAGLSAEDRAMTVLYEINGWRIAELAVMFEKPEGTVKARLSRARRKMRETLERYLPERRDNYTARKGKCVGNTRVEGDYALQKGKTTDR
jgi:RNA polymerase sigma-70 factor (ECF subfamily)